MSEFNPNEHLRVFTRRARQDDGSYKTVHTNYLDVKWRLVWFRQENPKGTVETTLLSEPGVTPAVVRAVVTKDDGTFATGFGQQGEDDWSDWLEKAETRAIGRALGVLGYGTQFADDLSDGSEQSALAEAEEPIADSPVEARQQPAPITNFALDEPAPNAASGGYECVECGTPIVDATRWTAGQLAAISVNKVGRIVCYACRMELERAS